MNIQAFITLLLFTLSGNMLYAQSLDDILNAANSAQEPEQNITQSIFKSTRFINGQTIEQTAVKELDFIISHRFGELKEGIHDLYGIDESQIRLGFEYGLFNKLAIGIGRSSHDKTIDSYIKGKIIRQQTGLKSIPLSISFLTSIAINTQAWAEPQRNNLFSSRLSYSYQLFIARKFNSSFSLQLVPTLVHQNLVATAAETNDILAAGIGGRVKLNNRVTLNAEYYYILPNQLQDKFTAPLAIGVDIETGGHVFQIHLSNSRSMYEKGFITQTTGQWLDGGIHLGFNINRVFSWSD